MIRSIFEFYVNASVHVAFAVTSMLLITCLEMNIYPEYTLLAFVFFGVISGYNFVKYAKVAGLHHRSLANSLKTIQIFSFVSTGLMVFFAFQLSIYVLLVAAFFGVFTLFYAVPFPKKNLRNQPGLKLFVVAVVWAGVTVWLPMVWHWSRALGSEFLLGKMADVTTWVLFIQRALIVVVLTLPFEIRDVKFDAAHLKTLPQIIGVKKTVGVGIVILVVVIMLEGMKPQTLFVDAQTLKNAAFLSLLLISILIATLLVMSQKKQSKYFASFGVESIPIVWVLLNIGVILFG